MAKIINITVRDKVATADETVYVCGNSDFLACFDFDEEWSAHNTKIARFTFNGKYIDRAFTGNTCEIPVIINTNAIKVGVLAGNLSTTTPAVVRAKKSILCEGGAPTTPESVIYGQIMEYNDKLSSPQLFTTIEKEAGNIVVRLHGDEQSLKDCTVRAGYFVRHGNKARMARSHFWRFPPNFDEDSSGRWGYAILSGQHNRGEYDLPIYPEVPSWMPNGGYMQTVFHVGEAELAEKKIVIDPKIWLLPLLKPCLVSNDGTFLFDTGLGIVGLRGTVANDALCIRFDLYGKGGKKAGCCKSVLRVGATAKSGGIDLVEDAEGNFIINPSHLHRSVY